MSSVSMFHQAWDDQMCSIENTSNDRTWDPQLKCFFGDDEDRGIGKFMSDVIFIQGLLNHAARACKEHQTAFCPYEGLDSIIGSS